MEIVGIAVKIVKRNKSTLFYVDDGSDVIRCVQFLNLSEFATSNSIDVGDTVSIKGHLSLSETNDEAYGICLRVSMVESVHDVHAEIFHWLSRMDSV